MLGPLGEAALAAANVAPGETVLDVGCGCGDTSIALATRGARVLGVDVSEPMLSHARTRAKDHDAVDFLCTDAARHAFEPTCDLVFSRFGVMFFEDPPAAFANLRTALRPGGRLCNLVWRTPAENPWMTRPIAAAMPHLPPQEPQPPRAPGPFAFAEQEYVQQILDDAGFAAPEIAPLDMEVHLGDTLDDAMTFAIEVGPLSRLMEQADDPDAVLNAAREAMAAYQGESGVHVPAACWIVTATG